MEVSPAKSLILSVAMHGGSYFFIQPRICERELFFCGAIKRSYEFRKQTGKPGQQKGAIS